MSETELPPDTVHLAEQLLELIKSLAEPASSNSLDPLGVWNAKIQIQTVCDQILEKTMGPLEYTVLLAESCQESQALHFVTSLSIADFIGESEENLPALSEKACVDSQFLGVAMSCLLGRGYFNEVGQFGSRVYKNNALSQVLRESHHSSLKEAIGVIGDEGFRAASHLLEAAKASYTTPGLGTDAVALQKKIPAVNIAFGFSSPVFEWMSSPEQAWRGERMGKAMQQLHRMANSNVSEDYSWGELTSPIVDVGGGIGSLEMSLAKYEQYNHLRFIIFDLPKTVEHAEKVWRAHPPLASRISFVGGNFMAPTLSESNLPQGKPTYIIRHVLHDWTDEDVVYILRIVRQAMPTQGRLLLVEILLQPTSSRLVRTTSMQLLALNSGVTRTQEEMKGLVRKAGLKVEKVTHMRAVDSVIEVVLD